MTLSFASRRCLQHRGTSVRQQDHLVSVEQRLKEAMHVARQKYDLARVAFENAREAGELGLDHAAALRVAASEYRQAVKEYSASVKLFADFLLNKYAPTSSTREFAGAQ